jgi:hypothetical protein
MLLIVDECIKSRSHMDSWKDIRFGWSQKVSNNGMVLIIKTLSIQLSSPLPFALFYPLHFPTIGVFINGMFKMLSFMIFLKKMFI